MNRCPNCDTPLTEKFIEVFGDDTGEIEGCPNCITYREMKEAQEDP